MKNRFNILLTVALLAMACSKETTSDAELGYGSVSLSVMTVSEVESSSDTRATTYTISSELLPATEDLYLTIEGEYIDPETLETVQFSNQYSNIDVYNEELPLLYAGTYTATVSDQKDISEESETNACFSGSVTFTVVARDKISTTIPVNLQNSIVRLLSVTDNFKSYFENGAELTASTESGSTLLYTHPDNSENEGKILFVAPDTKLYLEGWGQKQDPTESSQATTSTFAKSEIGTTTANMMSTIEVDAAYAGGAQLEITFDNEIISVYESNIELNPITVE